MPFVIGMTLSEQTGHVCDIALIVAVWIVLLLMALMAVRKTTTTQISSASDMLKAGCFFAIVGTIGCGYADQRWREWSAILKSGNDAVLETIKLPEVVNIPQLDTAGSAFVLVDASADEQPPPVVAAVNQVSNGSEPIPWLMLKPFDSESFKTLALTAKGMGRDWRSFRQWWAVPVPFSALKFGQNNQLSVMLQRSEEPLSCSIFGQYGLVIDHQNGTGTASVLPSTNTLSWDKGFATYEAGDSRLLEQTIMQGKVVDSGLSNGTTVMKGDLSYEHGLQGGHYRMRLAVPIKNRIHIRASKRSRSRNAGEPDFHSIPQRRRNYDFRLGARFTDRHRLRLHITGSDCGRNIDDVSMRLERFHPNKRPELFRLSLPEPTNSVSRSIGPRRDSLFV